MFDTYRAFRIMEVLIEFIKVEQAINMGGPMVGSYRIENKTIPGRFVVQEPVLSQNNQFVGCVRFVEKEKFWQKSHFKLVLIELTTLQVIELENKFEALTIDLIEDNKITIYESFHKEFEKFKKMILYNGLPREMK